jgi:hypothetical protein
LANYAKGSDVLIEEADGDSPKPPTSAMGSPLFFFMLTFSLSSSFFAFVSNTHFKGFKKTLSSSPKL